MIITLISTNSYALRRRLDELTGEFVEKYGELALERVDAEEAELQTVLDAAQSLPFLSERKMVVVRNLSALKSPAEQIEQIISSISDSTELVLYESVTDKRTVFYKTLKSKTQLEEYGELDTNELSKWLSVEAKKIGGELSSADATYLVERVGPNQAMLANELDKLVLYESKVTRSSIDLLTEPTPQSKVFELLDAAFAGNKKRALKLYEEQRAQKVEPQAILAMIGWQLRVLALTTHAGKRGADQIATDTGMNIYPVSKAMALAEKIDETRLERLVSEALDIDWRSKTTALDMDEALKTYIATL